MNHSESRMFFIVINYENHLVIQEGVVDECVCLLWNLHKHIEHGGSTFLRQSESFRESFKVQPTGMQRPVIRP